MLSIIWLLSHRYQLQPRPMPFERISFSAYIFCRYRITIYPLVCTAIASNSIPRFTFMSIEDNIFNRQEEAYIIITETELLNGNEILSQLLFGQFSISRYFYSGAN